MSLTVGQIIETYMKLRHQKESIENEAKAQVKDIKENMTKLEAWIKEKADADGVTSFKTNHGTAFLTTNDCANVDGTPTLPARCAGTCILLGTIFDIVLLLLLLNI